MKKRTTSILALGTFLVLGLASCGQGVSGSNGTTEENSSSSKVEGGDSSSSVTSTEKGKIRLFMYGKLYPNQMRSVYATLEKDVAGQELVWSSDNASVVSVSVPDLVSTEMPEAYVSAKGNGTATITCALKSDPSVKATLVLEVSSGEAMPTDLYKTITGSAKFTFDDQLLVYDQNYDTTVSGHYEVTTIYEEMFDNSTPTRVNHTDAYELIERNLLNPDAAIKDNAFIRTQGNKLAKETIDIHNKASYVAMRDDDGYTIDFDNAGYFFNQFDNDAYLTNEDFRTYDGGKTYHFAGGYMANSVLLASLLGLSYASADDIYFTVDSGAIADLDFVIDPVLDAKSGVTTTKYGRLIHGDISELGTAKITHVEPYKHEAYHDTLQAALTEIAAAKNYTYSFTVNNQTAGTDYRYTTRYTDELIDTVIADVKTGETISHTGIHKTSDTSYDEYSYDESTKTLSLTKRHTDTVWEGTNANGTNVVRYPTFDFSAEIFKQNEDGTFVTIADDAIIIQYTGYMPQNLAYAAEYGKATIGLDADGHIASIKANLTGYGGEDAIVVEGTFTSLGSTAAPELDFSKLEVPSEPTSWSEENKTLYADMKDYGITDEMLPYFYCPVRYKDYLGWKRSESQGHGYLQTNAFADADARDAWILSYYSFLESKGFVKTEETDANNEGAILYQSADGATKVSIAKTVNSWSSYDTKGATIWVYNAKITSGGTDA